MLAMLLVACSIPPKSALPAEDTSYLTPIPESTLAAFDWNAPIESNLQAVTAALASLNTTRLHFERAPRVVSVETMSLENARRQTAQAGGARNEPGPGEMPVWLVVFEGDYRIVAPDPEHTITP